MDYGSALVDRILANRMADTSSDLTFVDRLLHISEENPSFNLDDVKAETTTLLFGVRCIIDENIINICDVMHFIRRPPTQQRLQLRFPCSC